MKITVTKVIKELEKKHVWGIIKDYEKLLLINDVLRIVDEILQIEKNITILGKNK